MIRLHAAARDQRVRAGGDGFGADRLQFADFVAAHAEREQVIALHEEPRTGWAERRRKPLQVINGCGMGGQRDRRKGHERRERGGHQENTIKYKVQSTKYKEERGPHRQYRRQSFLCTLYFVLCT